MKGPIHFGGPVETGRGFVLHSMDYDGSEGTLDVGGGIGMTATLDILTDIAEGRGAGTEDRGARLRRLGAGPARGARSSRTAG